MSALNNFHFYFTSKYFNTLCPNLSAASEFHYCLMIMPIDSCNKLFFWSISNNKQQLNVQMSTVNPVCHVLLYWPPQVGNGPSFLRRWLTAFMRWGIYPEELRTCSGWAASTRQELDPSVMLQRQWFWQLILKAGHNRQAIIIILPSNVLFHENDHGTCTTSLLYRDSHPSGPDWAKGVKGYWIQTSNYAEELQFPLWDQ